MIEKALKFTRDTLDQFLRNRFNLDENVVVINNVVDSTGNIPVINQNKVVLSLVNVEKETNKPFYHVNKKLPGGNYADLSTSERYNLIMLVSANFDAYDETLKFLDTTILFFQINPSLDAASSSAIPAGINKLEYEIEKITYHQVHSLWTAMGAKYQPSAIYKIRLITIQGNEPAGITSGIKSYTNPVSA